MEFSIITEVLPAPSTDVPKASTSGAEDFDTVLREIDEAEELSGPDEASMTDPQAHLMAHAAGLTTPQTPSEETEPESESVSAPADGGAEITAMTAGNAEGAIEAMGLAGSVADLQENMPQLKPDSTGESAEPLLAAERSGDLPASVEDAIAEEPYRPADDHTLPATFHAAEDTVADRHDDPAGQGADARSDLSGGRQGFEQFATSAAPSLDPAPAQKAGLTQAPGSVVPLDIPEPVAAASSSVQIEVQPPDLGRVRIQVSLSDHTVYAIVRTEQSGVQDFLLRQQGRLEMDLGRHGLDVGGFRVEVDSQGQGRESTGWAASDRVPVAPGTVGTDEAAPLETAEPGSLWERRIVNLFA